MRCGRNAGVGRNGLGCRATVMRGEAFRGEAGGAQVALKAGYAAEEARMADG